MRLLIILTILLFTTSAYAGKAFYDPISNRYFTNSAGNRTLEQIKTMYNLSNQTEEVTLGLNEAARVKNGKLEKYNYKQENASIKEVEKNKKDIAKEKIKQKLGLTENEFQDLINALK
uniref:Uncharacterized protein n=1 Tax=viral metagenome TaxID=1070528 RepID=A0A6M3L4E9_9ZZZZ